MGITLGQRYRGWRPQLTRWEKRAGWAFFALYVFVLPFLMYGVVTVLDERLRLTATPAQTNVIYYTIVLLLLIAVFWDFLRHAGAILRDNFRSSFFVLAMALPAGLALTCLAGLIPLPVENPVIQGYREEHEMAARATWAVVALLRPAVEEILYRGLLFGSLRKRSRGLAYVVSTGLFAFFCVWPHAFPWGGPAYLLLIVQYLPLGAVLCWSYDVSGSVYTPMLLRMALQAAFLIFALAA